MKALRAKHVFIPAAFAMGLALAGYATLIEPRRPRLTRRVVRLAGLPRGLSGVTILHLSDLHVSKDDPILSRFLDSLSRLEVDIVAITGDFIESASGIQACARMVGRLRARQGIYAVMGNHDHAVYPRWSTLLGVFGHRRRIPTRRIVDALEGCGVMVLTNESRRLEINGELVQVAGIDDMFTDADDLPKTVENIDGPGTRILLSHSPDVVDDAADFGFHLVLSGHTHGGQVRLPLIGALTTHTVKPLRPASGLIYRNNTVMHVSRGLGTTGLPVRFLCPPEATVLRLRTR